VVPRFVDFDRCAAFFLSGTYRLAEQHGSKELRRVLEEAGPLAAEWLFLLLLYRKRIFLRA
jgi:hypothetical protein